MDVDHDEGHSNEFERPDRPTDPEGADEEGSEAAPIRRTGPPAKAQARRAAERRLIEAFGLSPETAEALARSVVDPAELRQRLTQPAEMGVPGGTLEYVFTRVWTHAVAPLPTNLRASPSRIYPVSAAQSPGFPPLWELRAEAEGPATLTLTAQAVAQVAEQTARAAEFYRQQNNLEDRIGREGVLMPITLVALRIEHEDGSPAVTLGVAVDGTSRVSSAHQILDLSASEVLYGFAGNDRRLRSEIERLRKLVAVPADQLSDQDVRRLRVLTMPAMVVVGFRPDEEGLDFAAAVRAYVGQIHVDPPKPWDSMAENDACIDAGLLAMRDEGLIEHWWHDFIAGLVPQEEAYTDYADQRTVDVVYTVLDSKGPWGRVFKKGVRSVSKASEVKRERHAQLAAELALRSVRGAAQAATLRTAVAAFERALAWAPFRDPTWVVTLHDILTLEELRDTALLEVGQSETPAAQRELALMALHYLVINGGLKREARGGAKEGDGRAPATVLQHILGTSRGINLLYEIVRDGRNGIAPRARDSAGSLVKNVVGQDVAISDAWLRAEFPNPGSRPTGKLSPTLTKREQLQRLLREVEGRVDDVEAAVSAVNVLKGDDGRALWKSEGLATDLAKELERRLREASRSIERWGEAWEERYGQATGEDFDPFIDEDEAA